MHEVPHRRTRIADCKHKQSLSERHPCSDSWPPESEHGHQSLAGMVAFHQGVKLVIVPHQLDELAVLVGAGPVPLHGALP